ncbi:MAG: Nif3-like dinuclear metal center hexameric protein [Bacteroidales bacterium]|nr:Nif3-like dinuclear metal center hexameric protein [Bacteroidales bacterium]
MKIQQVIDFLDEQLLPSYQESYDNAGLIAGDARREVTGVLTCVDVTPEVVDEATAGGFNLVVSHHPLVFGAIKRITAASEQGRLLLRLLENNICVYAAHTNLDNLPWGVNGLLAERLGVEHCRILRPVENALAKLVTYCPTTHADRVRQALFDAGAGGIGGYDCCSYNSEGCGTFRAGTGCNPFCGTIGELHREAETRIEVVYERRIERQLVRQLRVAHPYEEPAFDLLPLSNAYPAIGAGLIGTLPEPLPLAQFLQRIKETLHVATLRTSAPVASQVQRIALCGGSGSFLIRDALASRADLLLTADLKYHDYQQAERRIMLVDAGHYETERFAPEVLQRLVSEKFSTFACQISTRGQSYMRHM